jgi:hypothetical protein
MHDRTILRPCPEAGARTRSTRDYGFLLGRSFGAPMVDWAIPMPENGSLALAARSDSCRCRALHGIHSVIHRMQRSTCPFDRFGCNCPLHGTTGMHGPADAARNKQPGKAHLDPQATKRQWPKTTLAAQACACIRQSQAARQTRPSALHDCRSCNQPTDPPSTAAKLRQPPLIN